MAAVASEQRHPHARHLPRTKSSLLNVNLREFLGVDEPAATTRSQYATADRTHPASAYTCWTAPFVCSPAIASHSPLNHGCRSSVETQQQLEAFRRSISIDRELDDAIEQAPIARKRDGAAPGQPGTPPVPGSVWVDCYYYGFWINAAQAAVYKQGAVDALPNPAVAAVR